MARARVHEHTVKSSFKQQAGTAALSKGTQKKGKFFYAVKWGRSGRTRFRALSVCRWEESHTVWAAGGRTSPLVSVQAFILMYSGPARTVRLSPVTLTSRLVGVPARSDCTRLSPPEGVEAASPSSGMTSCRYSQTGGRRGASRNTNP